MRLYKFADRFWLKVDRRAANECWLWTGAQRRGYGALWFQGCHKPATHVALALSGVNVGDSMVCHTCDNPPCVNPSHLFLGNAFLNMRDASQKGRLATGQRNGRHTHPFSGPRGVHHPSAKVTAAQAAEIRRQSTGRRGEQSEMARRHGVSQAAIWYILNGRTWRYA